MWWGVRYQLGKLGGGQVREGFERQTEGSIFDPQDEREPMQ